MDFGELFQRFFWLIFPVLGMVMGMIGQWTRHKRAQQKLELLKSYIDQGKEPPSELVRLLDPKDNGKSRHDASGWVAIFLFGALTAGFVLFGLVQGAGDIKEMAPFFFVAIVMAGLCLGLLVRQVVQQRDNARNLPK